MTKVTSQPEMSLKLTEILNHLGLKDEDQLIAYLYGSNPEPGVCMETDCSAITEPIEPDQTEGWCSECKSNSVLSATELVLSV